MRTPALAIVVLVAVGIPVFVWSDGCVLSVDEERKKEVRSDPLKGQGEGNGGVLDSRPISDWNLKGVQGRVR